jgi:hypothetical protein
MGCGPSKQTIKEIDSGDRPVEKVSNVERTKVENYQVDGGAVYTGEMANGLKDGFGVQKCMLN